jgi:hypothetical protein
MRLMRSACRGCGAPFTPIRPRQTHCRPSCREKRRAPLLAMVEREGRDPSCSPRGLRFSPASAHAGGNGPEMTLGTQKFFQLVQRRRVRL